MGTEYANGKTRDETLRWAIIRLQDAYGHLEAAGMIMEAGELRRLRARIQRMRAKESKAGSAA